jgi:hypothetical protein
MESRMQRKLHVRFGGRLIVSSLNKKRSRCGKSTLLYQYPDFLDSNEEFIEFDSYIIPGSDLEDSGGLRMLEVDNRVIVPELTHIRFVVTSGDVIHKK